MRPASVLAAVLIAILVNPPDGIAEIVYRKGDRVRVGAATKLETASGTLVPADPAQQYLVASHDLKSGNIFLAEPEQVGPPVLLKTAAANVLPTLSVSFSRLDESLARVEVADFQNAHRLIDEAASLHPVDAFFDHLAAEFRKIEELHGECMVARQAHQLATEEAERLQHNAEVIERSNALDRGAYNQRSYAWRYDQGYYYDSNGQRTYYSSPSRRIYSSNSSYPTPPPMDERRNKADNTRSTAKELKESQQKELDALTKLAWSELNNARTMVAEYKAQISERHRLAEQALAPVQPLAPAPKKDRSLLYLVGGGVMFLAGLAFLLTSRNSG